jgi:hypothetical protein
MKTRTKAESRQNAGSTEGSADRRERSSTGVAAHVFALGKDVILHGPFDLFLGVAWLEIQLGIEGVEFEEVAMRLAQRRTGPSITNFSNLVTRRASDGACKTAYHRQ